LLRESAAKMFTNMQAKAKKDGVYLVPGGITISKAITMADGLVDKGERYVTGFFGAKITGIGSETIELKSPFSFTYTASHHNFDERFLYEPFKDPNVTTAQRDSLRQADIKALIDEVTLSDGNKRFAIGMDGKLREL